MVALEQLRERKICDLESSLQRPRSPNGDCSILMTGHRVPLHEELTCPTVFQGQAVTLARREARQVFGGYRPEPVVTLGLRKRDHDALSNEVSSTLADGASKEGHLASSV